MGIGKGGLILEGIFTLVPYSTKMREITILNFESNVKNCDFELLEQEWTKASVKIPSKIKLHLISRCFNETYITPQKARFFHKSKGQLISKSNSKLFI